MLYEGGLLSGFAFQSWSFIWVMSHDGDIIYMYKTVCNVLVIHIFQATNRQRCIELFFFIKVKEIKG